MKRSITMLLATGLTFAASPPAWSQGAAGGGVNGVPDAWFVYGLIGVILVGALVAIVIVKGAVDGTSWSLSDALSEEADVPVMETNAAGQPTPKLVDNRAVTYPDLRASTSRLIALMGMLVILVMYLGFGMSAMFRFAMTGDMPGGTTKVTDYLLAGMTLFAPYIVNKFASVFTNLAPRR